MVGDAETERRKPGWLLMPRRVGIALAILLALVDFGADGAQRFYLFALAVVLETIGDLIEKPFHEARNQVLIVTLLFAALIIYTQGNRLTDSEVLGVPITHLATGALVAAALPFAAIDTLRAAKKEPMWATLAVAAVAFVGIFAVGSSGWDEEIGWHVQQHEALSFHLGLMIAFFVCLAFHQAGSQRIWIAMAHGVAASALLLPWYLTDFASSFGGLIEEPGFLRRPHSDVAMAILLASAGGALVLLLSKHTLAPLGSALAGLIAIYICLTARTPFDGLLPVTLLVGFYVTLISAAIAALLSLWLAYKELRPNPNPDVFPRMQEEFPRL